MARIMVITTTCSGESLGPFVSSSKYLTSPAPLGGRLFLSFFAMNITDDNYKIVFLNVLFNYYEIYTIKVNDEFLKLIIIFLFYLKK